jgi:hypothetical protein
MMKLKTQDVAAPSKSITSQATNAAEALYELWMLIAIAKE